MKTETMERYSVEVTITVDVMARDVIKAENLVMDFVDGPIFTALLKRKKVAGVTYTMSADNPKGRLANSESMPAQDAEERSDCHV